MNVFIFSYLVEAVRNLLVAGNIPLIRLAPCSRPQYAALSFRSYLVICILMYNMTNQHHFPHTDQSPINNGSTILRAAHTKNLMRSCSKLQRDSCLLHRSFSLAEASDEIRHLVNTMICFRKMLNWTIGQVCKADQVDDSAGGAPARGPQLFN